MVKKDAEQIKKMIQRIFRNSGHYFVITYRTPNGTIKYIKEEVYSKNGQGCVFNLWNARFFPPHQYRIMQETVDYFNTHGANGKYGIQWYHRTVRLEHLRLPPKIFDEEYQENVEKDEE